MHNGFINVDNQKMSKSLHNFFTVRDVADLYGYEPIRYFMLTAGYRMPLNYTVDLIESCKNSLERLYTCRENLDFALSKTAFGTDETLTAKADEARAKFCKAMDDDLNTPDALAAVFDLVKEINTLSAASSKAALEAAAKAFDEITGVLGLMYNRKKDEVPAEVTELVEKRAAAKKAKDWATTVPTTCPTSAIIPTVRQLSPANPLRLSRTPLASTPTEAKIILFSASGCRFGALKGYFTAQNWII